MIGLTSLCLMLSLTACVTTHKPILPPSQYLQDCTETPVAIVVNGDLVRKIESLRTDLDLCNADKASLREWAEKVRKGTAK